MEQHNPALLTVTGEEAGGKLIRFLERRLEGGFPPAMFHKWIRTGQVRVNGKRAKPFLPLGAGDQVRLPPFALPRVFTGAEGLIPAPAEGSPLGGDAAPGSASRHVPLPSLAPCAPVGTPFLGADVPVVAMTADMLVVAKPAGLAVQGGSALTDSLVQRLADAYTHQPFTPAPVHRLDRATSGLVVIGMTHAGLQRLSALFATPQGVQKEYLAVVHGHWPHAPCVLSDTVEKREEKGFERMAVVRGGGMLAVPPEAARGLFPLDGGAMHPEEAGAWCQGANAVDTVSPPEGEEQEALAQAAPVPDLPSGYNAHCMVACVRRGVVYPPKGAAIPASLLRVRLLTGKKHQIRVQLAHRGFPLVGEPRYGGPAFPQLLLHAAALRFPDGFTCTTPPAWKGVDELFASSPVVP